MSAETIRELQAYGFFFFVVFLVFILYGYCYHLYKSEKTGRRDYEKYSNLALQDDIDSNVLERK
ncbi:MAG: cytochrome c oxidase, cbb3-type, CcoQ subunit [Campylobacter sp.]|nr:cytochrome c oxidase, cbb3-type, CcoQ subunit [Campylobacter sp.]